MLNFALFQSTESLLLGLNGVTAVNRVEMEFRFVPAVAMIQRQVEEDVLAKGTYSILRIAFIPSVQASAEQNFHNILQKNVHVQNSLNTKHQYEFNFCFAIY